MTCKHSLIRYSHFNCFISLSPFNTGGCLLSHPRTLPGMQHVYLSCRVCISFLINSLPLFDLPPSERFWYRPGVYRVHRSSDRDARLADMGHTVLHHALQLGSVLHVWSNRGCPHAHQGPETTAQVDPS